jgi:hypothetical protein
MEGEVVGKRPQVESFEQVQVNAVYPERTRSVGRSTIDKRHL